jgi:hypothetical protein
MIGSLILYTHIVTMIGQRCGRKKIVVKLKVLENARRKTMKQLCDDNRSPG